MLCTAMFQVGLYLEDTYQLADNMKLHHSQVSALSTIFKRAVSAKNLGRAKQQQDVTTPAQGIHADKLLSMGTQDDGHALMHSLKYNSRQPCIADIKVRDVYTLCQSSVPSAGLVYDGGVEGPNGVRQPFINPEGVW